MDLIQEFEKMHLKKGLPYVRPGDTLKIYEKIMEAGRERIQVFEGIVIRRSGGKGMNATITLRKISFGIGIERTFPLHLPNIVKIEIVKRGKVRRARLYYLRNLKEKANRLQGKVLSEEEIKQFKYEEEKAKEVAKKKRKRKKKGKKEIKRRKHRNQKALKQKKATNKKKSPNKSSIFCIFIQAFVMSF